MLAQLSTVKSRLAISVIDYDDLLKNAIKAFSARFDKETNRTSPAPPPPPTSSTRDRNPAILLPR